MDLDGVDRLPAISPKPPNTMTGDLMIWSASILISAAIAGLGWPVEAPSQDGFAERDREVSSPDGLATISVRIQAQDDGTQLPNYRVEYRGSTVVDWSDLGLRFEDGAAIGADSELIEVANRPIHEVYDQHPGKRSHVVADGNELVIRFRERDGSARPWHLFLRAYNDGVAFRYQVPEQEGWKEARIVGERTNFRLDPKQPATALPLANFTTSHEAIYLRSPVGELPDGQLFGLPMLLEVPGAGWAAVAEANLTDYAGLYLFKSNGGALETRLAPRPDMAGVAVKTPLPFVSPWRVVAIGQEPGRLVESDLMLSLNEPSAIGDTSWIVPGKTTFPWWNGFYLEDVPFQPGLNTATAKHYIDFCAEAGIPYHSLDGLDNIAWYGGTIVPYEGADITTGIEGLDLKEVLEYAKSKNVKIRLWMHWQAAEAHMERAFPMYREWGVEGVMLDFMDRDDQVMNAFLRRVLVLAAENHLTVTLHGVSAPTGLERTFPNLLNHEAARNLEYDKWAENGTPPVEELTIPFTRMLAGPVDYHQGSLRGVPRSEFHPVNEAPLVMGTAGFMLGSYVVLQDHLPMMADYPSAYRGNPALAILVDVPCTWDDTRVLAGEVGKLAVVARRSGDSWWVGAMTAGSTRDVEIPLDFLEGDTYSIRSAIDDPSDPAGVKVSSDKLQDRDIYRLHLEADGGALLELKPAD